LALVDVASGEIFSFLNDRLGTPQMLADSTNTIVWEGIYKPFGEADVNPNSSVVNNFRFPGQYYDEETGFHYNYHRYYDPQTGRYLTGDPIGLLGGVNLFVYAILNPINRVDFDGLDVIGFNTGGSMAGNKIPVKVGASTAILFESDGKKNKIGIVTTTDKGVGIGKGLFWHAVYGPQGHTIQDYADATVSYNIDAGYVSYSFSFDEKNRFHEIGIASNPGPSTSITFPKGKVIFEFEYSFGAADTFWGELIYDLFHPRTDLCE
jgi:RHS repeat-associated protein